MTSAGDVVLISKEEAVVLLGKLIRSRPEVKAVFTGSHHVSFAFDGFVYSGPEHSMVIRAVRGMPGSFLRFDPSDAASIELQNTRRPAAKRIDNREVMSTLSFSYLDMTKLTLFELRAVDDVRRPSPTGNI